MKKDLKRRTILIGMAVLMAAVTVTGCGRIGVSHAPQDNEMIREAFEDYIDSVVEGADDFDRDRHPVHEGVTSVSYDGDTFTDTVCDQIWLSYAIEDFDGDGQPEMMVHRDYLIRSDFAEDTLCMFEYTDGSVTECRENECQNFPEHGTTDFYPTAAAIKYYDDDSCDVLTFSDSFSELYGELPGKSIIPYYKDDESGGYKRLNPSHYRFRVSDVSIITQEEFENEIASIHSAKDGTLLEPLEIEFKDIEAEPAVPEKAANDEETEAWLSWIRENYIDSDNGSYPRKYAITDFDNDRVKECVLYTSKDGKEKLEGCFDSPDDKDIHQSAFSLKTMSPYPFDEFDFYNNGMAVGKNLNGNICKEYTYVYPVIQGNEKNSELRKELGIDDDQYILYRVGYDDKAVKNIMDSSSDETVESIEMSKAEYFRELGIIADGASLVEPNFYNFKYER